MFWQNLNSYLVVCFQSVNQSATGSAIGCYKLIESQLTWHSDCNLVQLLNLPLLVCGCFHCEISYISVLACVLDFPAGLPTMFCSISYTGARVINLIGEQHRFSAVYWRSLLLKIWGCASTKIPLFVSRKLKMDGGRGFYGRS